jgi:FtsZ-binding cell division protein ZapB
MHAELFERLEKNIPHLIPTIERLDMIVRLLKEGIQTQSKQAYIEHIAQGIQQIGEIINPPTDLLSVQDSVD